MGEDTWRFWEALYCGSIPVTDAKPYFAKYLPAGLVDLLISFGHTSRSRENLVKRMQRLLADPEALDRHRAFLMSQRDSYDALWKATLHSRIKEAGHSVS